MAVHDAGSTTGRNGGLPQADCTAVELHSEVVAAPVGGFEGAAAPVATAVVPDDSEAGLPVVTAVAPGD